MNPLFTAAPSACGMPPNTVLINAPMLPAVDTAPDDSADLIWLTDRNRPWLHELMPNADSDMTHDKVLGAILHPLPPTLVAANHDALSPSCSG